MHPNLALKPTSDNDTSKKFEDYYPRSKTGLGGLSLSAAGSSQVWRKDLSQTFAPLYVNPETMSTEVKAVVRVPDDAFPSIRNAPGSMISFNYFVEILVDVHAKLAQGTSFPTLNFTRGIPSIPNGPLTSDADDGRHQSVTAWGLNCVDTSQILRERSAVHCIHDLVIGTKDSAKARGKRRQEGVPLENATVHANGDHHGPWHHGSRAGQGFHDGYDDSHGDNDYYPYGYDYPYDPYHNCYYPYGYWDGSWEDSSFVAPPALDHHTARNFDNAPMNGNGVGMPTFVPPPHMPDEAELTEKERMRQAEQQLLPSRPPDSHREGLGEEALRRQKIPTAPFLPDENNFGSIASYQAAVARQYAVPTPQSHAGPSSPFSAEADLRLPAYEPRSGEGSFARAVNTGTNAESKESIAAGEDKQELERRRLQAIASSPETGDFAGASHSTRPTAPSLDSPNLEHGFAPSAPVLNEAKSSAASLRNQTYDASYAGVEPTSSSTTDINDGDMPEARVATNTGAVGEVLADVLPASKADSVQDAEQVDHEFTEVKESGDEGDQEKGNGQGL